MEVKKKRGKTQRRTKGGQEGKKREGSGRTKRGIGRKPGIMSNY